METEKTSQKVPCRALVREKKGTRRGVGKTHTFTRARGREREKIYSARVERASFFPGPLDDLGCEERVCSANWTANEYEAWLLPSASASRGRFVI